MNRIAKAFAGGKAFIPFVTAGDPSADKTVDYFLEMEMAGAHLRAADPGHRGGRRGLPLRGVLHGGDGGAQ